MTLLLDPRFPLIWRTPHSLQLGVDQPVVVLTVVTTAHEKMLAALAVGLTPEGLTLIGTDAGLRPEQVADFERAIRPALVTQTQVHSARVEIDGVGPTADRLGHRLHEAGFETHLRRGHAENRSASESPATADLADSADFAVIVGDYVLDPERRGRWLRRDIPHVPIVFGDTSVTIGPFIEPGTGPCLYCLELHRTDADPMWPTLASQLLGRVSTAQTPFLASEAATIATRMVLNRARRGSPPSASESSTSTLGFEKQDGESHPATSLTVNAETGEHRTQSWLAHPECACTGITAVTAQYLPETEMECSFRASGRAMPTTRDEDARVPA